MKSWRNNYRTAGLAVDHLPCHHVRVDRVLRLNCRRYFLSESDRRIEPSNDRVVSLVFDFPATSSSDESDFDLYFPPFLGTFFYPPLFSPCRSVDLGHLVCHLVSLVRIRRRLYFHLSPELLPFHQTEFDIVVWHPSILKNETKRVIYARSNGM